MSTQREISWYRLELDHSTTEIMILAGIVELAHGPYDALKGKTLEQVKMFAELHGARLTKDGDER